MKLIKSKKADEKVGMPLSWIIGFIILFALVIFMLGWQIDLRDKIIEYFKEFF